MGVQVEVLKRPSSILVSEALFLRGSGSQYSKFEDRGGAQIPELREFHTAPSKVKR